MGEEGTFRKSRRSRGIKKEADLISLSFHDQILKKTWLFFIYFFSNLHHLFDADENWVIIVSHPFWVIPDHFLELRTFVFNHEAFINLFLAFTQHQFGIGVVDDIFHLADERLLE